MILLFLRKKSLSLKRLKSFIIYLKKDKLKSSKNLLVEIFVKKQSR